MTFPAFSIETYNRLNAQQGEVYTDVFAVFRRDHPIYTFNREWESMAEVRKQAGFYPLVETSRHTFELIEKIHYGRFAVVKSVEKKTGYAPERFDVYQITDNGRLLRMGEFQSFYSEGDAVDCIVILHRIETGEF